MSEKVSIGRVVHYVTGHNDHLPAMVVAAWNGGKLPPDGNGCVNLQVFLDGSNSRSTLFTDDECGRGVAWKTSVVFDPDAKPGTWHWPERV